ncbi:MAG: hypothetical protein IJU75_07510 [Clostridia bacterium]|nr:hypothetical protein [Clostridia bacterium]
MKTKRTVLAILLFAVMIFAQACGINGSDSGMTSKHNDAGTLSESNEGSPAHSNMVFLFNGYADFRDSITDKNSEKHIKIQQYVENGHYNEEGWEGYINGHFVRLFEGLSNGDLKFKKPAIDGIPMTVGVDVYWNISVLTEELFGLPWIWYYCDFNGKTVVVGISYLDLVPDAFTDEMTIEETIKKLKPNFPLPDNADDFRNSYTSIQNSEFQINGTKTDALVYENTYGRTYYRFIYDDSFIVNIWSADKGNKLEDAFWNRFSIIDY